MERRRRVLFMVLAYPGFESAPCCFLRAGTPFTILPPSLRLRAKPCLELEMGDFFPHLETHLKVFGNPGHAGVDWRREVVRTSNRSTQPDASWPVS